jgi:hypothetical protein
MKQIRPASIAAAVLAIAAPAFAQDHADIDRTQLIGNRVLPKVLYIVPWKKPLPGDLSGRPLVSVLDEALAPVDRDVFRRQVQYEAQTTASATNAQARAPTAAATTTPAPAPKPSAAVVAAPAK